MKRIAVILYLMVLVPSLVRAHSALNRFWGEVPVDMLITGDVLIVKPLVVPEDVTLTVEPGAVVRFEKTPGGDNRIVVKGRLVAVGAPGREIRFVPKDEASGPWLGIEFQPGSSGRVERCIIAGASRGIVDPGRRAAVKDAVFR
jgi:hypothetical protein